MASGQHSMLIQPVNTGSNVLILFDYFIYRCVLYLILRQVILMDILLARMHRVRVLSHHLHHPPRHLPQQHRPELKGRLQDQILAPLLVQCAGRLYSWLFAYFAIGDIGGAMVAYLWRKKGPWRNRFS